MYSSHLNVSVPPPGSDEIIVHLIRANEDVRLQFTEAIWQ